MMAYISYTLPWALPPLPSDVFEDAAAHHVLLAGSHMSHMSMQAHTNTRAHAVSFAVVPVAVAKALSP